MGNAWGLRPHGRKALWVRVPPPSPKLKGDIMSPEEQVKHTQLMNELDAEWNNKEYDHTKQRQNTRGIRSSQISAIIAFLIKKGVL